MILASFAGEIGSNSGAGAEGATAPETLRQTDRDRIGYSGKREASLRCVTTEGESLALETCEAKLSGFPTEGAGKVLR